MTKEELEKEAEKFLGGWLIDPEIVKLLVDFAEPREEKIKSLGERCLQLQKDKGELIDKVTELEAQIEKMKNCDNCKHDCKLVIAHFGGCDFLGKKEKWEMQEK